MSKILEQIAALGILPLVTLEDAADAAPLAQALAVGGLPAAEVTFRTNAAPDAIRRIAAQAPQVLVGAGTVHTVEQAAEAAEAGAQFVVTPGFQAAVVRWCVDQGIDVLPGVSSPTDIEQAMEYGLDTCKFFPSEACGGTATLKALAGPYAGIRFLPTGGIHSGNLLDYLSLPNVAAVGGSFPCPGSLVKARDWPAISALCQELVGQMLGFELAHVGINTQDATQAQQVASRLGSLFGKPVTELPGAYFAGSIAEVVKGTYLGARGHIGVNTRDINRAVSYLVRTGVALDRDTAVYRPDGTLAAIYLKEQVGGFALHLRQA